MSASNRHVRLLLVCQPLEDGVPQQVLNLIQELPDTYELDLMCPRGSMLWRMFARAERVTLHDLGRGRRPGLTDVMPFLRLLRLSRRADVIHAHSSKAGFLTRLAALLTGRRGRTVFHPHCWSFWAASGAERRLYVHVERLAARWCRNLVAITEFERDAGLDERIGQRRQYVIIPNGVDLDRFSADPDPVEGRILMLGRLVPQKRPELALLAMAELTRLFPEVELHVAGDGELKPELEDLARQLGVDDVVKFLGIRSDIPDLLMKAHCFVLTSRYEVCPTAVIEAMAAGVPVVAVASGGIEELVEPGVSGLLAPADPARLAAALHELLRDPSRARALGDESRRRARALYSREVPAGRIESLYQEIVAEAAAKT